MTLPFTLRYPLRLLRFEDGLYVAGAGEEAMPLLGARLTHVAGRQVNSILGAFTKVAAGWRERVVVPWERASQQKKWTFFYE
ncbi:hypothetical protein BH24PSE2_BH24PSE2_19600 [soil metagenome]